MRHIRDTAVTRGNFIQDNADVDVRTGENVGTYGIKQNYMQETPAANFPPINYKNYAKALVFDEVVKKLIYDKEFKFRPDLGPSIDRPPVPEIKDVHPEVEEHREPEFILKNFNTTEPEVAMLKNFNTTEPEIAIPSVHSNGVKKMNTTEPVRL